MTSSRAIPSPATPSTTADPWSSRRARSVRPRSCARGPAIRCAPAAGARRRRARRSSPSIAAGFWARAAAWYQSMADGADATYEVSGVAEAAPGLAGERLVAASGTGRLSGESCDRDEVADARSLAIGGAHTVLIEPRRAWRLHGISLGLVESVDRVVRSHEVARRGVLAECAALFGLEGTDGAQLLARVARPHGEPTGLGLVTFRGPSETLEGAGRTGLLDGEAGPVREEAGIGLLA